MQATVFQLKAILGEYALENRLLKEENAMLRAKLAELDPTALQPANEGGQTHANTTHP